MNGDPRQPSAWHLPGVAAVLAVLFLTGAGPARAQHADREASIISAGLLAGPTSGLTLKALFDEPELTQPGASVDMIVSFNGEGYLHISGHSLTERALADTPLRIFLGPGMVTELDDGTLGWGLSTTIGGYFVRGPYEVLVSLMPRLILTPEREGVFGAAVGLRYRF